MPRKEFPVYDSTTDEDPPTFVLGDEEFACMGVFPASAGVLAVSDDESVVGRFIELCLLTNQDVLRFQRALANREKVVSSDTLADISNWLVEVYTDRPTEKPGRSSRSPRARTAISAVD